MIGSTRGALIVFLALTAQMLKAQPPDTNHIVFGQVVDAKTGQPIIGADIAVLRNGQDLLIETRTAKDGGFVASPLLNPNHRTKDDSYVVVVRAASYAMTFQNVPIASAAEAKPVEIKLAAEQPMTVRVVTVASQPVVGATIRISQVVVPVPWRAPGFTRIVTVSSDKLAHRPASLTTDKNGNATLHDLPGQGDIQVEITHPDYTGATHRITLPQKAVASLLLSRETIVLGRVILGDTGETFYHPRLSAKVQEWRGYKLWRTAPIEPDGSLLIRDIPSLEMMGQKNLSINLNLVMQSPNDVLKSMPGTRAGITLRYIQYGGNWNAFLTLADLDRTRWYLCYAEAEEAGLRYQEGEQVEHDLVFHPLARVMGRVLLPPGEQTARVSYYNPRSSRMYSDWTVPTDAEGNFEIFVPTGDVILNFQSGNANGTQTLKDLKAHETREVEYSFEQKP
jgi:hypothetical protein